MSRRSGGALMPSAWNVDLDRYLNPFLWSPRGQDLPPVVARFLGYRDRPPRPLGNVLAVAWCFVGTVAALSLIFAVCKQVPGMGDASAPLILGSFGAAAVLEFYAIDSPLSQPRNLFIGQLGSSVIGVAFSKGFAQFPHHDLRWLAGSLSCACSTIFMGLTGTIHPPAGATALLAVTDDNVTGLGWTLVPVVAISCCLMLVTALLINNIQRAFPAYWWTAEDVGSFWAGTHGASPSCSEKNIIASPDPGGRRACDVDEELGPPAPEEPPALVMITRRGVVTSPEVRLTESDRLCLERIFQGLSPAPSISLAAAPEEAS